MKVMFLGVLIYYWSKLLSSRLAQSSMSASVSENMFARTQNGSGLPSEEESSEELGVSKRCKEEVPFGKVNWMSVGRGSRCVGVHKSQRSRPIVLLNINKLIGVSEKWCVRCAGVSGYF